MNAIVRPLSIALAVLAILTGAAAAQDSSQYTGQISNAKPSAYFPVNLVAGQAIIATVDTTSGSLDPMVILRSPDGTILSQNDDRGSDNLNSALGALITETGTYSIEVTRYPEGDSTGSFLLTVRTGTPDLLNEMDTLITRVTLSGPVQTVDTPHFRIHYTLSGDDRTTESFVDEVALAAEDFFDIEVNQLGWAIPPSDGVMGGDERYDVYISDLIGDGEGALGVTSPETVIGDNPNSPAVETGATTSYLEIDNDYANSDAADVIALMRTTFAHEFNHALQFGYDSNETHNWIYEATASWMETAAAGKDQDATGYVDYAYQYPELCFGSIADPDDGALQYGEWPFLQMLTDLYGPNAVRGYWESIAQYDGWDALGAFLQPYNMTVPQVVAAYRLKNLARDYRLAPEFGATVWLEDTINATGRWQPQGSGIQNMGANYYRLQLAPGVYSVTVSGDSGNLELWAVGLVGAEKLEAIPLGRGAAFDTRPYADMYLMVFDTSFDDALDACEYELYSISVSPSQNDPVGPALIYPATFFERLR